MRVLVLANAILRGLALAKAKSAALVFLAVAALLVAGGLAAQQVSALVRPEPNHPKPAAQAPVQQPALLPQNDKLPAGAIMRLGEDRWLHGIIANYAWFLPDGKKVVTVNVDRTIRIWEFPDGKEIARMTLPGNYNSELLHYLLYAERRPLGAAAALSADGAVIAASPDGTDILFYDVASFQQLPARIELPAKDLFKGFPLRIGVESLAFAPDGKRLAAMTSTGELIIWDWRQGKELHKVALGRGEQEYAMGYRVVFSPDGRFVAVGQDVSPAKVKEFNTVTILNAASGALIKHIRIQARAYRNNMGSGSGPIAFSPDSKTLAFAMGSAVIFAETATGNEVGKLNSPVAKLIGVPMAGDDLSSLAFSKDGTKLYANSCSMTGIMEWDVAGRKLLRTTDGGGAKIPNENLKTDRRVDSGAGGVISLSPDDQTLMITGVGPRFFDLTSGKDITAMNQITPPMKSLQFLTDGKTLQTQQVFEGGVIGGGWQKWDLVTGTKQGILKRNDWPMDNSSTISPDGKVIARLSPQPTYTEKGLTLPRKIVIVDTASDKEINSIELDAVFGPVQKQGPTALPVMLLSTDGHILALSGRTNPLTVQMFDSRNGKQIGVLILPPGPDSLPVGKLAGQRAGNIEAELSGAAFSPDGRCLAINLQDGTTALYELATGTPRASFGKKRAIFKDPLRGPGFDVYYVTSVLNSHAKARLRFAFSPDGRFFAYSGADAVVHVSDLVTGKTVTEFKGHGERVTMVVFARDGKTLASASDDSTVLIWDVSKLARPKTAAGAPKPGELEAWWQDLAANDAANAFAAIAALVVAPKEAVAWIKDRVKPAAAVDDKRVHDLIAQLDAEQFNTRVKATQALLEIGEQIVPILDKTLSALVPLETKQRLEALRDKLTGTLLQGEALRAFRAVEVLELIGTPEARQVLEGLARGAVGARLTTSAQAALKR